MFKLLTETSPGLKLGWSVGEVHWVDGRVLGRVSLLPTTCEVPGKEIAGISNK